MFLPVYVLRVGREMHVCKPRHTPPPWQKQQRVGAFVSQTMCEVKENSVGVPPSLNGGKVGLLIFPKMRWATVSRNRQFC